MWSKISLKLPKTSKKLLREFKLQGGKFWPLQSL